MKNQIKVLVVDDSAFMRGIISRMLNSDPDIRVAGVADTAEKAFENIRTLKPDVLVLNIQMPGISGLDILHMVMREIPTPTIMVGEKLR